MNQLSLRDASKGDAADLAILENIAGHGFSLWFWQGAVIAGKAQDAYEWGRQRMINGAGQFGWQNGRVVERDGSVVGATISYMLDKENPQAIDEQPAPMRPVMELFSKAIGDYFVDSISVFSASRKLGAGRLLMNDVMDRARVCQCHRVSLVAEDSNSPALALYHSFGFQERDRRPYVPFNKTSNTKNWLLLSAPIH